MKEHLTEADLEAGLAARKPVLLERILSGVAHEIGNYTQSILLVGQFLHDFWNDVEPVLSCHVRENGEFIAGGMPYSRLGREMPVFLNSLAGNAEKIHALIMEARTFSRPASEPKPMDLGLAVHSAVLLAAHALRKARCPLTVSMDGPAVRIRGKMQQVVLALLETLFHLCEGAAEPERGIRVSAFTDREDGCGVCEVEAVGAMLEPQQVLALREAVEAEGAGPLAATRAALSLHGGRLCLLGESGAGVRLQLRFRPA